MQKSSTTAEIPYTLSKEWRKNLAEILIQRSPTRFGEFLKAIENTIAGKLYRMIEQGHRNRCTKYAILIKQYLLTIRMSIECHYQDVKQNFIPTLCIIFIHFVRAMQHSTMVKKRMSGLVLGEIHELLIEVLEDAEYILDVIIASGILTAEEPEYQPWGLKTALLLLENRKFYIRSDSSVECCIKYFSALKTIEDFGMHEYLKNELSIVTAYPMSLLYEVKKNLSSLYAYYYVCNLSCDTDTLHKQISSRISISYPNNQPGTKNSTKSTQSSKMIKDKVDRVNSVNDGIYILDTCNPNMPLIPLSKNAQLSGFMKSLGDRVKRTNISFEERKLTQFMHQFQNSFA